MTLGRFQVCVALLLLHFITNFTTTHSTKIQDETEPIVIHSVDLVEEESWNSDGKKLDTVAQQMFISSLSEVTLGPKQNAIIPMTFVPRFPSVSSSEIPETIGKRRRNNLGYEVMENYSQEFQVKTNIVLDTSRGVIKLPIKASSVRNNGYHLPDTIHFSSIKPSDSPTVIGKGKSEMDNDCYDVHMSNPLEDKGLQIFDVVVSRPDLVKMYHYDEEVSDDAVTKLFKNWQGKNEQRSIAPGVNDEYVITLCPRADGDTVPEGTLKRKGGLPPTSDMNDGFGYLQIRTNVNVLVVNLEETKSIDDVADMPNMTEHSGATKCDSQCSIDPLTTTAVKEVTSPPRNLSLSVTEPPQLEIQLVPYVSPSFVKMIELRNTSPYPIKVLQTALSLDFMKDQVLLDAARGVGLTIDAKIGTRNKAIVSKDPHVMDEVVIMTCGVKFSSRRVDPEHALRFTGTIHVAATADNNTDPKDAQLDMSFPFAINVLDRQVHFVVDPSSPNVPPAHWTRETRIAGGVKSLTELFYPITRLSGNSTGEAMPEEITYNIGVVSPIGRPIRVGKMEVVDSANGKPTQKATKLCSRFTITSFNTYSTPQRIGNSSMFDLGKATVKYIFDKFAEPKSKKIRLGSKTGIGLDNGPVVPENCFLHVITDSSEGASLFIPILLFPGRLDATAIEDDTPLREKTNPDKRTTVAPSIVTGFDDILTWLRSFGMGSAVKKVLKTMFDSRLADGPTMLSGYLTALSAGSLLSGGQLIRPILLNVGSVVHDEVQSFPLYLANYNPVPVEVSIDVGEVEGMSISIAREYSHGKRDGNSLLDRIPPEERIKGSKVKDGRWKGHAKRGLRNYLVKTSEFPQAISSSLQYRDDVSLSSAADIQPVLRRLYIQNDVGYFHAESTPRDLLSTESSKCQGPDLNPPIYSDDELAINGSYPFIMSDSLSYLRRLKVCRKKKSKIDPVSKQVRTDASDDFQPPVLLPPGGVGRFEVKVRCPSRRVLKSDVTNFLSTGLVLSTSYGQVIPIFVSFEALLGNLQVSTLASPEVNITPSQDSNVETIIDISPGLFLGHFADGNTTTTVAETNDEQLRNSSVPLYVTSSFAQEVVLNNVESCNPWFDVVIGGHDVKNESLPVTPGENLEVGGMTSRIPCRSLQYDYGCDEFRLDLPTKVPRFPSFYECALEWLQKRNKVQPRGCGLSTEGGSHKEDHALILKVATSLLRGAIRYNLVDFNDGAIRNNRHLTMNTSQANSTAESKKEDADLTTKSEQQNDTHLSKRSTNPYVPRVLIGSYAQLRDAWKLVTEAGMNVLSTNLKAQIDYSIPKVDKSNLTQGEVAMTQTLSVAMREVAIRTSLELPTLVDNMNGLDNLDTMIIDGSDVSVLQFTPTRVADVNSLMVPLRNPTAVPVRVRLATFAATDGSVAASANEAKFGDGSSELSDRIISRYLNDFSPVYVQNENVKDQQIRGDAQHWWEGGGGFVLPDDRGDLIQARYNLSITAGPSAHISLINPQLYAFNGLHMGCGTRCAVKDDAQQVRLEHHEMQALKRYSPIGAAAAAGSTLMGRPRPQRVPLAPDDRHVTAGGATPASPAHPAFAIPYSSLDEIVLPPYGTGELGPILFRPPGRHAILGCDTAVESNATTPTACATNAFESMVFIENSLTGLERVVVRGEGASESVVFLDPPRSVDSPFGDLEHRYGRSTLVFSGSAERESSKSRPQPVRKEVVVHNDGDLPVEFGRVHLSEAPDLQGRGRKRLKTHRVDDGSTSKCEMRRFRLLGCSESGTGEIVVNGVRTTNLANGFALAPGENASLVIEHHPDCAFSSEYVTLNLEYRDEKGKQSSWYTSPSRSRHGAVPRQSKPRSIELLVGFEMTGSEMASCIAVGLSEAWSGGKSHFTVSSGTNSTEVNWHDRRDKKRSFSSWLLLPAVRLAVICLSTLVVFWAMKHAVARDGSCNYFRANLVTGAINGSTSPSQESDWPAAFRCLARVDPLSSELQAVGREQARQLVLERYKSVGAMAPHCISSAGVLNRDRAGAVGGGGRGVNGTEKKAMTFSDAMFRGAFTDQGAINAEIDSLLPCSLGWRAASARGMVKRTSRASKSKQVLIQREAAMAAIRENGPVSDGDEHVETDEEPVADESLEADEEIDEHDDDVISTSDSEGSASVTKDVEVIPPTLLPEQHDLSGFAKVSSQKSKGSSRNKDKKKIDDTKTTTKQTAVQNSNGVLDKPQVLVYKKEPSVRTMNHAAPTRDHVKNAWQDGKASSNNTATVLQTRAATQTKQQVLKKAPAEPIKPKAKRQTVKSKQTPSVPPPPMDERTIGVVSSPIGTRSMTSVSSSAQSSPVSVSSRSTSRSSTSRSKKETNASSSSLRPPPGLAPPPGFASGGGIAGDSLIEATHRVTASNEGLPPMVPSLYQQEPSPLQLSSGKSISRKTIKPNKSFESERPLSAGASPILSSQSPVLTSTQIPLTRMETEESQMSNTGFDVMDFLDEILGEPEPKEEPSIGDLLAEKTTTTTSSATSMPFSSDPWATERKSRASAYGIHVDDEAADEEEIVYAMLAAPVPSSRTNGTGALHNSVPLLTPAALLNQVEEAEEEEGGGSSSASALFNRGSFYSSLLKE